MIPKDHENFLDDDDDFNEDDLYDFDDSSEEFEDHLLSEDYDDAELERRRVAYADLKKNDKIFNNTYNFGLDGSEDESDAPRSGGPEIKLDSSSPDYHLYDPEKYADHIDLSIIQRDIYEFVKVNSRIMELLGNEPEKKKFAKAEINEVFGKRASVGMVLGLIKKFTEEKVRAAFKEATTSESSKDPVKLFMYLSSK